MEYNKQTATYTAKPVVSKTGKTVVLLTLFGGASFYGITAVGMIAYDVLMKMFG